MELTRKDNGKWKPGESGNIGGRPLGHHTRHRFSNAFLEDLSRVWAEHGAATMLHTASVNPEAFFAICARLLPKDVAVTIQAQAPAIDAADLEVLKAIKAAIPDAGEREPGEIFSLVLDAVRAHGAKAIECVEKPSPDSPIDNQ